ncbi:hypothetical protein C8D92_10748 [Tamilnaduibacter salinus]|uniref:Phosphodiesterase n=1 Tax=Tamilnaduibacter salinus TaxID=1484056 RepID=A0A2U1CUZ7_9GAMM|nr:hypothetical protein [Tamilnaduibacter salinus]PVY75331.1 hypothetical protein C8D92_10748 [Tamilnaduibacter salinus]
MSQQQSPIADARPRVRRLLASVCLGGLMAVTSPLAADEVRMPIGAKPMATGQQAINVPRNGMSQAQVEQRFGAPRRMVGPVGEPPIREWHYEDFVVYFERNRVIHTVVEPAKGQ